MEIGDRCGQQCITAANLSSKNQYLGPLGVHATNRGVPNAPQMCKMGVRCLNFDIDIQFECLSQHSK